MNCNETERWLDAYCDGELEVPRSLELEEHMRGCPACAQKRASATAMSRHIRSAAFAAPENLHRRIRAAVRTEPKADEPVQVRFQSWLFWAFGSVAASLILAFILAQTVFRPDSDQLVLNEIVDSHIRSLIGNHEVDVASSDQHTVRPWFEGKIDFAPPVPDLSGRGFEIVGGRLDYINGHAAAALVYRIRKHYISLFIWPSGAAGKEVEGVRLESRRAQRGYQNVQWKSGSMTYWAISEISADELRDFAKAFMVEATGH